ncbi:carbonic anhydrase/acetyltransferase-like protein (isoleucine patch superfamily) [Palleronia aestuarii]|uniref:Carbonic anhydrase/acetyltransferase-like protein (Isoleucine patch superfamily) n=1 Tax=Palleronia aestuarii TaxID=568105 RepID=A0A2W7N764_9RHOB|nr:gamma carbonic anhydrase family protein [Palleronia aestuarii]PZX15961.1 carbonic anhydrase/acetyltransferase-like protein (isoleucine patch superfamily) [Palleronia aestuarii]
MPNDPMSILTPYHGTKPEFAGPPAYAGAGAAVLGRARIGRDAWLGPCSVIRADGHCVEIGDDFFLSEHATVHIAHDVLPTHIAHHVTAGPRSVIHACDVASDCVVEREAVILDGARIGPGAVISARSVVFPRTELEGGWIYAGVPAKPVERIDAAGLEARHQKLRAEQRTGDAVAMRQEAPAFFLAPSATTIGEISCGIEVGIWYGCELDAGTGSITIGDGTNVQDNSLLRCGSGKIEIAGDVTIGHNVTLAECRVETRSLVGIGAVIAPGTVVEKDVLVAAGAETEPGQVLTSGKVWAGRPAKPIGDMNEARRKMLSETLPTYRGYAAHFRDADVAPIPTRQSE